MSIKNLKGHVFNPEVIRGQSAYEIAVMHGFEGTEEEWLESYVEGATKVAIAAANNAENFEKNSKTNAEIATNAANNSVNSALTARQEQELCQKAAAFCAEKKVEAEDFAGEAKKSAELAATYVPKDGNSVFVCRTMYDHEKGLAFVMGDGTKPPDRAWQIGDIIIDEFDASVYRIQFIENGVPYIESLGFKTKGDPGEKGDPGKNGKTPVKGTDYYTDADKAEIVRMVIESLGGNPVFGYVDQNNNIIVSGNLADGSYSVKYEMEDSSTIDIGDLVLDTNVYYSITNNLTNCVSNNSATQAVQGGSYYATISANDGYELKSISVTMGGSAVSVTNGVINIRSVTGNIVITAMAEETATDEIVNLAGTISVGRLGSDGTIRNDADDCRVTDYVSVKNGDVVRVEGIVFSGTPTYPSAVYDNSKSKLSSVALANGSNTYYTVDSTTNNGAQITIISDGVAYVRFSGRPTGTDEDIIVTVNQEIN